MSCTGVLFVAVGGEAADVGGTGGARAEVHDLAGGDAQVAGAFGHAAACLGVGGGGGGEMAVYVVEVGGEVGELVEHRAAEARYLLHIAVDGILLPELFEHAEYGD